MWKNAVELRLKDILKDKFSKGKWEIKGGRKIGDILKDKFFQSWWKNDVELKDGRKLKDVLIDELLNNWWKNDVELEDGRKLNNDIKDKIFERVKSKKIIRVIGGSGLGKTSIVCQALRENKINSIYIHVKENDENTIRGFIKDIKTDKELFIIVDECDWSLHTDLCNYNNFADKLHIITIGFEAECADETIINLKPWSFESIKELLLTEEALIKQDDGTISKLARDIGGYPSLVATLFISLEKGNHINSKETKNDLMRKLNKFYDFIIPKEYVNILQKLSCYDDIKVSKCDSFEHCCQKIKELYKLDDEQDVIYQALKYFKEISILQEFIIKDSHENKNYYYKIRPAPLKIKYVRDFIGNIMPSKFFDLYKYNIEHNLACSFLNQTFSSIEERHFKELAKGLLTKFDDILNKPNQQHNKLFALLSLGARKVNYKDSLKQHKDNLKAISPNNSNIRMLILTKNQFRELVEITGAETLAERILKNDNIILKF